MQPKPGQKQAVIDLLMSRRMSDVDGFAAAHIYDSGDDLWGVAIFRDEDSYRANASDPKQNERYEEMRALLAADPEWLEKRAETEKDGAIVASVNNQILLPTSFSSVK